MSTAPQHVASVLADAEACQLPLDEEVLRTLNPKHLLVAQAFLHLLQNDEVAALAGRALSARDLRLLLIADEFFERVADPETRSALSSRLRSPACAIDDVVRVLAEAWLRDAYLRAPGCDRPSPGADALYTVEGAARALGVTPADVFAAIGEGRVDGVVCVTTEALDYLRRTIVPRRER